MIAAWMLYSVLVTGLFALAAAAAERALRLASRQARLVWLGAMIAALCVVAPALLTAPPRVTRTSHEASTATPGLAGRSAATTTAAADARGRIRGGAARRGLDTGWVGRLRAGIQIPDAPSLPRLDRPLVAAWIAASLAWIAIVIASAALLRRSRRRWRRDVIDGVPVLVSHDVGPAVVGVLRYAIVVPRWVADLDCRSRELILIHEREHVRVADPLLLLGGMLAVTLMPWNLALWYMVRQLRYAAEVDCDRRVLRVRPDARAYGALLLDVSERTLGTPAPAAALTEPASLLERRLSAMTRGRPRLAAARLAGSAALGATLVASACYVPRPREAPTPGGPISPPREEPSTRERRTAVPGAFVPPDSLLLEILRADSARVPLTRETREALRSILRQQRELTEQRQELELRLSDMQREGVAARLLTDTTLYNRLIGVSQALDELLARKREPHFAPDGSELEALVRRYYPEASTRGFEPGTLVGFVFDVRDSVIRHVAVPFDGNERIPPDEKIRELFPYLRGLPPRWFGSAGVASLTPPGAKRPLFVVWAAMRGGREP